MTSTAIACLAVEFPHAEPLAEHILSPAALEFVADLHRRFEPRRQQLLSLRGERQRAIDRGELPDFLPETQHLRTADWKVAPFPADLQDRRVEITGPVDRKMIINALNSGAKVFMADFEDSTSPTFHNCLMGQVNLFDAVRRNIEFVAEGGKEYRLKDAVATLMVRPRGWHLCERNLRIDGAHVSAALFDFGLFFFHNAKELLRRGSGPYFYLPKLESHLEARLWNEVFEYAQKALCIPQGTIKATVLIETILAAFEMDEILYELRDHSAGLNCGRWDYIFSFIKKFRRHAAFVLPDRALVTMTTHFMRSYSLLAIQTCHRRGAHAMGGMAAQIPIKNDEAANRAALEKVIADKRREAADGHDGTWVAHPGLVSLAQEVFDQCMPGPHQIDRPLAEIRVTAADLLRVPQGAITRQGVLTNVEVGLRYLESWLRGVGCVPLHDLMEDAATAEISRAQLWQWIHHPTARQEDGAPIDAALFEAILGDVTVELRGELGEEAYAASRFETAASLYREMVLKDVFEDFLTLPAYQHLD